MSFKTYSNMDYSSSDEASEPMPDRHPYDMCPYVIGGPKICGKSVRPGSEYCTEHRKMYHDAEVVHATAIQTEVVQTEEDTKGDTKEDVQETKSDCNSEDFEEEIPITKTKIKIKNKAKMKRIPKYFEE